MRGDRDADRHRTDHVSSYTSPDEARSDLFLSGAAYLFGGTLLAIVFNLTRITAIPGVGLVLAFAVPILTTVLVPVLLMRYRGESMRDIGLGGGGDGSVVPGLVVGLPLVAAAAGASLLAGRPVGENLPLLNLGGPAGALELVAGLIRWMGLLFLALYGTVKARDAFRGEALALDEAVVRIGRFVGIAGGVAIVLIILSLFARLGSGDVLALLSYPIGLTLAVALALRVVAGSATTTMPTVLTPVVLLALGPFGISFNAAAFVFGVYGGALYAAVGLLVAILVERTRRGGGVLALALVIGVATQLAGAGAAAL
jgi:hypothetical protein